MWVSNVSINGPGRMTSRAHAYIALQLFLARLHEVHRAIVVTSVVRVYVYHGTLSVKVFKIVIS